MMVSGLLTLIGMSYSLGAQSLPGAIADLEAGRLEKAERALTMIVSDRPDSAEAHFYLGLVHFRAGRPAAARPFLERAVKLSPASAPAWKSSSKRLAPIRRRLRSMRSDLPHAAEPT